VGEEVERILLLLLITGVRLELSSSELLFGEWAFTWTGALIWGFHTTDTVLGGDGMESASGDGGVTILWENKRPN